MECAVPNEMEENTVRIYLIRHGYAEHNQGRDSYGPRAYFSSKYKFSSLMPRGIEEAQHLRSLLVEQNQTFDRVYTSPLDRAMQTTSILFDADNSSRAYHNNCGNRNNYDRRNKRHCGSTHIEHGEIMVVDYLRELNYSHPCNERRSVEKLQEIYPKFNYSLMGSDQDIIYKYGDMQNRFMALINEIRYFAKCWYSTEIRPPNIGFISHESFLLEFVNHYLGVELTSIGNCEMVRIDLKIDSLMAYPSQ